MDSLLEIKIALHFKGTEITYGKFALGTERQTALDTFNLLKGRTERSGTCMIQMVLTHEVAGLPIRLATIFCNLKELKENVAIISKEIFRISKLEEIGMSAFE